jgi:hypothetical protein
MAIGNQFVVPAKAGIQPTALPPSSRLRAAQTGIHCRGTSGRRRRSLAVIGDGYAIPAKAEIQSTALRPSSRLRAAQTGIQFPSRSRRQRALPDG